MLRFTSWRSGVRAAFPDYFKKPWLVVGKGPSSDHIKDLELEAFNVFTLNDAVRLVDHCAIAHAIDVEVFDRSGEEFQKKARWILTPEVPHENMKARRPLAAYLELGRHLGDPKPSLFRACAWLVAFERAGNLVAYKKKIDLPQDGPADAVPVRYFSAEAAIGILGLMGVRTVRTIGIDGGSSYGQAFKDLVPLENGRQDFNRQFERLIPTAQYFEMDLRPVTVPNQGPAAGKFLPYDSSHPPDSFPELP